MIYIGIDPGQKGGYAIIDDAGVYAYPWDDVMFVESMQVVAMMQEGGKPAKKIACIEKVGAMPKQGVRSMFNFGKSAGYIEGVLSALGIPYQLIPPATWKRSFSLIGKDKRASVETCHKLFPELDLKRTQRCKTDSDGKAEAALICLYAARNFGKKGV